MSSTHPLVQIARPVAGLKPSATLAINERSHALMAEGKRVFKLGLGQSPFPVPAVVRDSLSRHAHQKDYLAVQGLFELRQAIVDWHERRDGIAGAPERVMVGPGSKELMFILQMVHEGVLTIPAPSWVSYEPQARILNKAVQWVDTSYENGWRMTAEEFERTCAATPGRPRLLILNYPNNPTGMSYDEAELMALAEVARRHGVVVLSDEIYGELHHRGSHQSIARFYPEGTIVSSGLSKWCGAGGWRLGYCHFPETLEPLLHAMAAVASETFTSVSAPIQHAAIDAFLPNDEIDTYLHASRKILTALGAYVAGTLRSAGVMVHDPEGGFYVLPDFSQLRDGLSRRGITHSAELTEAVLTETGVAFLPGDCFGRDPKELTARMSYVDFDGTQALAMLNGLEADSPIDSDLLKRMCGPTVEAIDRVADWCRNLV